MYRKDIDGLRGLAILPVVIYHMFPKNFPGGFIGVDFFFVISGYLISSIILEKLETNSFSFVDFYVRRITRIFPALFLLLASVLFLGWFFLLPVEFRELGKHIASGAGFISNIALYKEVGYFNSAAELKPLLHLWSLGIEEQFYIFLPLILIFAWKKKYNLFKIFIFFFSLSFLLNVLRVSRHTDEVFFLLHTRFWELLLGCLLAHIERSGKFRNTINQHRELFSFFGLSLAFIGFFVLNAERYFPGAWALIPTLSTFLLIAAGPETCINKKFLSHKWLVSIGLISYPLYLWHWPFLSFGQIVYGDNFSLTLKILLITVAFFLAYSTYWFAEKPIRNLTYDTKKRLSYFLMASVFGCGGIGLMVYFKYLPPHSNSDAVSRISAAVSDWDFPGRLIHKKSKKGLRYHEQGNGNKEIVFIGDSHIEQYYPRMEKLLESHPDFKIIFLAHGGCPPIRNVRDNRDKTHSCPAHVENSIKEALRPEVHSVVLGASWYSYFGEETKYYLNNDPKKSVNISAPGFQEALKELQITLALLKQANKKTYLLLNIPMGKEFDPKKMVERSFSLTPVKVGASPLLREEFEKKYLLFKNALIESGLRADIEVIDPLKYLCRDYVCPTVTQDGDPLYKDESHFRPFYSRDSVTYLDRVFK